MTIWNILVELRLFPTIAEMKRTVNAGGVSIDNEIIKEYDYDIPSGSHVLKVGKRIKTFDIQNEVLKVL